jgi:hypothetical protein
MKSFASGVIYIGFFPAGAKRRAEEAGEQARQTWENTHGDAAKAHDFSPSPELENLYREVAKCIHQTLQLMP